MANLFNWTFEGIIVVQDLNLDSFDINIVLPSYDSKTSAQTWDEVHDLLQAETTRPIVRLEMGEGIYAACQATWASQNGVSADSTPADPEAPQAPNTGLNQTKPASNAPIRGFGTGGNLPNLRNNT